MADTKRPTLKDLLPLVQWDGNSTAIGLANQVKVNTPGIIQGGVSLFEIKTYDIVEFPYFDTIEDDEIAGGEAEAIAQELCAQVILRVNAFDDLLNAVKLAKEEIECLFVDHVFDTEEEYQKGVKNSAALNAIAVAIEKAEAARG